MPETLRPRVLVIGGGPGGYVAAIRAGQLGLDTVLVDAERLGGTCLLRGCIPSKALIHAADRFAEITGAVGGDALGIAIAEAPRLDLARTIAWKDGVVDRLVSGVAGLLARAKVRVVEGWATFSDAKSCTVETAAGPLAITAEHVILAAGSEPVALPGLPFGGKVISSTEALSLPELPQRLVVVGAGYIGLELGIAFRKLGAAVTVVEMADRILPRYDAALTRPVRRWLARAGVELHLGAKVAGLDGEGRLAVETAAGPLALAADKILVTVGRRPARRGLGPRGNGARPRRAVRQGRRPVPHRDARRLGDRRSRRRADAGAQGDGAGRHGRRDHRRAAPPFRPGLGRRDRLQRARDRRRRDAAGRGGCRRHRRRDLGLPVRRQRARARPSKPARPAALSASSRAATTSASSASRRSGRQIAELAGEFAHALAMGAVLDDVAHTIHVHPTLGEAFGEAALLGLGHALHL